MALRLLLSFTLLGAPAQAPELVSGAQVQEHLGQRVRVVGSYVNGVVNATYCGR